MQGTRLRRGGGIAVPSEVTPTTLTDREQTLSSFTTITGDETNQYAFVEFKPTQAGYYVLQANGTVDASYNQQAPAFDWTCCQGTADTVLNSSSGGGSCERVVYLNANTNYQYALRVANGMVSGLTAKYIFAENVTLGGTVEIPQGQSSTEFTPMAKIGDVSFLVPGTYKSSSNSSVSVTANQNNPGFTVTGLDTLTVEETVDLTFDVALNNTTTQARYTLKIVNNGSGGGGEPGSGEGEGGGPGGPGGYVSDTVYLKVFEMGTGSYVMGELGTGIGNTATFLMEYYDGSDFTLVTGTPSYYYQTPNGSVQDTNGDYVTIEKNELGYWDITAKQASNGVLQVTYNGKPYSMNVRFYGGPAVPDSTTTVVDMTGSSEKTATDDQWTTGMENVLYVSYTPTEDGIYAINGAATKESGPMSAGIALCGDDQGLVKGTAASCDETNWNVSIRCDLKKDTTYYFRMTGEPSRMGDVTLTVVKNGALNGGPAENLYDVPDLVWPLTGSVAEGKITNLDSQLNQDAVDIWNSLVDRNDDWYTFYATFTPTEDGVYKLGIFIEGGYLSEAADKPMAQTFLCIQAPLWSNGGFAFETHGDDPHGDVRMADYYNLKQGVTYQFQILLCKHGIDYSKDVQFQLIKTTCPLRTDDIFADERGVTATVQGFYGLGGSHDTVTDENRNVTIDATYGSGNTTTTNVSMEAGSVATMSSGQVSSATILTNEADVCFDGDVVDQMAKNGEPINFSVDRTENQGTVTLDFALTGGEQEIIPESSASTNGTVTIATDYGDIPDGKTIQVNYVPDNGEAQKIDATYDATTGEVSFKTSHFSKYEIVLTENPCNGKHSFTVYKTIKDATCTQDGEKVAICDNCKVATDTKIIQKTGHQFTRYETTKAATCTTDGEETAICDNCKTAKDTKTVAKTGHSYVNGACEHCGGLDTSCDGGEGCPTHSYKDIKATAWYHTMGYVDYVVGHKIMIGTGTNPLTFQPEEEMTRAEMVTALWNLAGKPAATKAPSFTDVKEKDWFYAPIAWAYEMELAVGMENGTFQPDEALTREQMVTFLYRYARLKGQNVTAGTIAEKFTDKAKVAEYAQKPFAWAIEQGIITGMGTTPETLAPTAKAERCQLAKILTVYLQTAAS